MAATTNANGITKRTNYYFADPTHIVRKKGWNPRIDFGDIKELANSIRENGFRQNKPLLVRRDENSKFQIIDGDRRFSAIELLLSEGHSFPEGIPIVIQNKEVDELQSLIHMFTANLGKPFLPLEEAAAYKRMRDAGLTIEQVCKKVGRAHVHVLTTLSLLDADESVKEAMQSGEISATLAKTISSKAKGDKEKQKELVKTAKSSKEGKKAAQKEASEIKRREPKKDAKKEKKVEVAPLKMITQSQTESRLAVAEGHFKKSLESLGLDADVVSGLISESDNMAMAFQFGVVSALQAVLGKNVKLYL